MNTMVISQGELILGGILHIEERAMPLVQEKIEAMTGEEAKLALSQFFVPLFKTNDMAAAMVAVIDDANKNNQEYLDWDAIAPILDELRIRLDAVEQVSKQHEQFKVNEVTGGEAPGNAVAANATNTAGGDQEDNSVVAVSAGPTDI